jgi:hypothetical protein
MINGTDYVQYFVPEYNMTVNVPITIIPNEECSVVFNGAPEYPYPSYKLYPVYPINFLQGVYSGDQCRYAGDVYTYYSGFFGRNQLYRLCSWNGTNKKHSTTSSYGLMTCEEETYNDATANISIQRELEKYISQNIDKCVNFTEVLKRSPSNITQSGSPETYVTFGENGFNVRLEYPFILSIRGRQPIKTFYDFSIDKNMPFKELYDYAYYSSKRDVQEAGFDMVADRATSPYLGVRYYNYTINRTRSTDTSFIDVIQMINNNVKIDTKPLIFQFAIKNRRPALDYIHQTSPFLNVDMLVEENGSVEILPNGYDPDDDDLSYNYYGWKEDYEDMYNYSDINCTYPTSINYVIENCTISNYSSKPHNFTGSVAYQQTFKNARYDTNRDDRGYHELIVYVNETSRQRLYDYQVIRIFVFDKPKANITLNNLYPLIDDHYASVEDPYILNGTNSTVGLSGLLAGNNLSKFLWNDSLGEFNIGVELREDRNKTLYLPVDVNGTGTDDIRLIKPNVFSKIGLRNISLTILTYREGFTDTNIIEIDVKQCLPHRNNSNPSYPYNSNPNDKINSYFANHTCCNITYGYRNGAICYINTTYGSNRSFINYQTKEPSPPAPYAITYPNLAVGSRNAENDIFNRTFIRRCDNNRGNICNGTASETRETIVNCADINPGGPEFNSERCVGPPVYMSYYGTSSPNPVSCVSYGVTYSFERVYGLPKLNNGLTADGTCTTSPQCASTTSFNAPEERYKCTGYCSGGGCNAVNSASCRCDNTCAGSTGSSLCNGLSGSGNPNGGVSCIGGIGPYSSRYRDTCGACRLVDATPRVCVAVGSGNGCTAPVECNFVNANSAIGTSNNEGCNYLCDHLTCGIYAYDTSITPNGGCHTTCTVNENCASGYTCCNETMVAAGNCAAPSGYCFVFTPV